MDSTQQAQIIALLSQQNFRLLEEVAALKAELAKTKTTQVSVIAPVSSEVSSKRKTYKKKTPEVSAPVSAEVSAEVIVPPKPKHASHIATGKYVSGLNKIRKELMESARFEGEW
jgi:hypothetical protein